MCMYVCIHTAIKPVQIATTESVNVKIKALFHVKIPLTAGMLAKLRWQALSEKQEITETAV